MKKSWLYYFSPFVLSAIACIVPVCQGLFAPPKHENFEIVLVFVFAPLALFLLLIDRLIKELTNKQIKYIWLIESILVIAAIAWSMFYSHSSSTTPS